MFEETTSGVVFLVWTVMLRVRVYPFLNSMHVWGFFFLQSSHVEIEINECTGLSEPNLKSQLSPLNVCLLTASD